MDNDSSGSTPSGPSKPSTSSTPQGRSDSASAATPQPVSSSSSSRPIAGPSSASSAAHSSQNSKRRRGLGIVTPNACTECRKKRAKVRAARMLIIDLRLPSQLSKLLDSSMPARYIYATRYTNDLNFNSVMEVSHAVAVKPKKSSAFTKFLFANPRKISAAKSSSCDSVNDPATKSFPLWFALTFGKMFWAAYATASPSTQYLTGSPPTLIRPARKHLLFRSTRLEIPAW